MPLDLLGSPFDYAPTDRESTTLPAVYRSWSMITDQGAQLPFVAVDQDTGTPAATQPSVIRRPDPFERRIDTLSAVFVSLVSRGNAYLRLGSPGSNGLPTTAIPINPDEVQVQWNQDRTRPIYHWRDRAMAPGRDLLHIPLFRTAGELEGLSPIAAARYVVNGARQSDEYARRLFSDSAIPSGVITSEATLDKEEADRLKAQWAESHTGQREPAVLSGGVTFDTLSLRPDEAQFLQTAQFRVRDIARLYGIPGSLLEAPPEGGGSSIVYQNLSTLADHFTRFCLRPYLERIERAWDQLLPAGLSAQFDLNTLLRADTKGRFEAWETGLRAGFLTVNEVREEEGRPPIEGGNTSAAVTAEPATEGVPA